mmetsp:Transcript_13095/g.19829  ORF Transcript_13095/g.19829 Transcript_13095/m.19829 type:complete len:111 (+) Transcript_13095:474-806(+)
MTDDEVKNCSSQGSNMSNSTHRRKRRRALGGGGCNPLSDVTNQVGPTSSLESKSSRYVSYRSTEAKEVSGMASTLTSTSTASTSIVTTGGGMTALTPPSTRGSKKKKLVV